MLIEQAVFTSANTRQVHGYHLIGRSTGIGDSDAKQLIRWSPTHAGLSGSALNSSSINYFQIAEDWCVLSRSVYGGPEYSGRGGTRIVTFIAMLRRTQLIGYSFDPMLLASCLMARGFLRLKTRNCYDCRQLEIPDSSALAGVYYRGSRDPAIELAGRVIESIREGQRVMVVGAADSKAVTAALEQQLDQHERSSVSFSTGMRPSVNRPFTVQFQNEVPQHRERELRLEGIVCCRA